MIDYSLIIKFITHWLGAQSCASVNLLAQGRLECGVVLPSVQTSTGEMCEKTKGFLTARHRVGCSSSDSEGPAEVGRQQEGQH